MKCPICGKEAKTRHGLQKHLTGSARYGGHDLADSEVDSVLAGGPTPRQTAPPPPAEAPVTPSLTGEFVHDFFATIAANKALPKYQFERRVDAVLALFLPELLEVTRGWKVHVVAPELPIKSSDSRLTTNADYALYRHASEGVPAAWILLELKTDAASVRAEQLAIYQQALERGMEALRRDLDEVMAGTSARSRGKYQALALLLDAYPMDPPMEILYLLPESATRSLVGTGVGLLTFSELRDVELRSYPEEWAAFKGLVLPVLG